MIKTLTNKENGVSHVFVVAGSPGGRPDFFSVLMLRPPPRTTLFPYTTLFRSQLAAAGRLRPLRGGRRGGVRPRPGPRPGRLRHPAGLEPGRPVILRARLVIVAAGARGGASTGPECVVPADLRGAGSAGGGARPEGEGRRAGARRPPGPGSQPRAPGPQRHPPPVLCEGALQSTGGIVEASGVRPRRPRLPVLWRASRERRPRRPPFTGWPPRLGERGRRLPPMQQPQGGPASPRSRPPVAS